MQEELIFLFDQSLPKDLPMTKQSVGIKTFEKRIGESYQVNANAAMHRVNIFGKVKYLFSGSISIYDSKPSTHPRDPRSYNLLKTGEIWIAREPSFKKFMPYEEFQNLIMGFQDFNRPDESIRHLEAIVRGYDALDAKKEAEFNKRLRDEHYQGQSDADENRGRLI